jgi:phospholipid/cholesterol/gamma-HCH transport system substrate-binding protein
METRAHYVAVGAFVLTMITLAFIAVLWLARAQLTTQQAFYDIYFSGPVSGLRVGAPAEYNGVPVGKVSEIYIDPANVEQIRVTVEIDAKVAIKTDAAAAVETNILSGVSFIQITGGTKEAPLLMPQDDQRYAVIRAHRSRFASVTARAPQLLEKLIETADHLNDLLDEKNREAVAETLDSLRQLSVGLNERSKEIGGLIVSANTAVLTAKELVGNVDRSYSGPDGIGDRAAAALADFDKVAKNLGDTNRLLQQALQDARPGVRTFTSQTLGDIGSLVGEVRQLVSGVNRLVGELERDPSQVLFGDRREGYRPR